MVDGWYVYTYMVYKPTNITGAPTCTSLAMFDYPGPFYWDRRCVVEPDSSMAEMTTIFQIFEEIVI